MKYLFSLLVMFAVPFVVNAQTDYATDVKSVDSIIKAVYEVISGDAGKARDWERFKNLFHKDARLVPTTGKSPTTGLVSARALTPEDYIKLAEPIFLKDGFYEIEIARKTEGFGHIAHAFSSYQSKRLKSDRDPFMRGINSFQLLNDGKRWWILTIYWQQESADYPIPQIYLK